MAIANYGTVASAGSISDILKDFYIGPLQEQLNNEVMCLEMFEKAKVSWAGRQAIVPIHVSRNTGVGYATEATAGGTNLPTAGTQGVARLSVEASYLYGRMAVTGQAVAAAKQGGTASFIGTLDLEMENLKSDIRDRANEACVTGGRVIGFTCQSAALTHNASVTIKVDGNLKKLASLADGGDTVDLEFLIAGSEELGVTNGYRYINATIGDSSTSFLRVTAIDPVAGTVTGTVETGNLAFNLVPAGIAATVRLKAFVDDDARYSPDKEPVGILGNLFDPHHFGVGRQATVSGDESTLQTFCLKADDDSSGDAREALTLKRMQTVIDGIASVSGLEPDLILCNSAMRSAYIDLLNGNVNAMSFDPKSAATTVDGGVTGISFAGKPIRTSRHVPPGMFIFLNTSTFKLAILEDGKFADMDGNVLSRVTGADAFEGFYKWYYNHYCYRPNANGVLAGVVGGNQTS
jgi:hypothetical protein